MEIRFKRLNYFLGRKVWRERLTKFDIYVNGINSYYAESKQFTLTYTTCLYNTGDNDSIFLRLTVKKVPSLTPLYHVIFPDGEVLEFRTITFWSGHFRCVYGADVFDIYYWRNGKCTVDRNGTQVAYMELPSLHSGNVIASDDCNPELIMAFVLAMDRSTTILSLFTDLLYAGVGRIRNFQTIFDPDWKPVLNSRK